MKNLLVILVILMMHACVFTDSTLKVAHHEEANITGPISEVDGMAFSAPQLEDARLDKARIGWKRIVGAQTADIDSEQPVDVIIENAITDAMIGNGHSVMEDGQVKISGTVDRFWFDTDIHFWTVDYIGDVQCTLDFIDSATNSSIYSSTYSGTYIDNTTGGEENTWTEVMSKAVDKLIEDIVFDEDLTEALDIYQSSH